MSDLTWTAVAVMLIVAFTIGLVLGICHGIDLGRKWSRR